MISSATKTLNFNFLFFIFLTLLSVSSCKKDEAKLIFKFKFDPTQERLGNLGEPVGIPSGNAAQNPKMNNMSAHYIELAPSAYTQLGGGEVVYKAEETTAGGEQAINFSKAIKTADNEVFFSIPLEDIAAGDYEYIRVSLAYQNADVILHLDSIFNVNGTDYPVDQDFSATLSSFVGYNTYIQNHTVKTQNITVNGNRRQGYWGFESTPVIYGQTVNILESGIAPEGATTVVNPIASTSPIPAGSCVVTGPFKGGKLNITGKEKEDIVVVLSLSTNQSFEWVDKNSNGKWDPTKGENIVDMGLRGLVPYIE